MVENKHYLTPAELEEGGYLKIREKEITYVASGVKRNITAPEEKVRAEYYLELVKKYKYPDTRIQPNCKVPGRRPDIFADLAVFEDDEKKKPYIVVECKRGCLDLLCDKFYELLEPKERWAMRPGQFYFTHVVYPQNYPTILKLTKYNPQNEYKSEFQIKRYSDGDEKHYPIKELNLHEDEMYYIYTGKIRLAIVLGYIESDWLGREELQKIAMCAPVFGFKLQHPQEMIIKIQAFQCPNMFYLPPDPKGCREESAVRFELIQPITKGYFQPFTASTVDMRKPVILSDRAYWLLMSHLVKYLCGKIIDEKLDSDIMVYKELLLESFKEQK